MDAEVFQQLPSDIQEDLRRHRQATTSAAAAAAAVAAGSPVKSSTPQRKTTTPPRRRSTTPSPGRGGARRSSRVTPPRRARRLATATTAEITKGDQLRLTQLHSLQEVNAAGAAHPHLADVNLEVWQALPDYVQLQLLEEAEARAINASTLNGGTAGGTAAPAAQQAAQATVSAASTVAGAGLAHLQSVQHHNYRVARSMQQRQALHQERALHGDERVVGSRTLRRRHGSSSSEVVARWQPAARAVVYKAEPWESVRAALARCWFDSSHIGTVWHSREHAALLASYVHSLVQAGRLEDVALLVTWLTRVSNSKQPTAGSAASWCFACKLRDCAQAMVVAARGLRLGFGTGVQCRHG